MANIFKEKQFEAEYLSELYNSLSEKMKYVSMDYQIVGVSDVQSKHWKTGELEWEDEDKTIPKYDKIWDYVKKEEDAITEEDRLRIKVLKNLMTKLEKML